MTWSYSGDPAASAKDNVRFVLGDTQAASPRLSDEEIAFVLQQNGGNVAMAAIRCCETIIANLSGARDETVGSVSISFSQQAKGFSDLLAILQRRATMGYGFVAYAGGVSRADMRAVASNPDRVPPAFTREDCEQWVDGEPGRSRWGGR